MSSSANQKTELKLAKNFTFTSWYNYSKISQLSRVLLMPLKVNNAKNDYVIFTVKKTFYKNFFFYTFSPENVKILPEHYCFFTAYYCQKLTNLQEK